MEGETEKCARKEGKNRSVHREPCPKHKASTGSAGAGDRQETQCSRGGAQVWQVPRTTHLFLQMSRRRSTTRPVMRVKQIQTMVRCRSGPVRGKPGSGWGAASPLSPGLRGLAAFLGPSGASSSSESRGTGCTCSLPPTLPSTTCRYTPCFPTWYPFRTVQPEQSHQTSEPQLSPASPKPPALPVTVNDEAGYTAHSYS